MLCQLSYRGRAAHIVAAAWQDSRQAGAKTNVMRRAVLVGSVLVTLWTAAPAVGAPKPAVAALQVALRAQGLYPGPVDGLAGPLTRDGLVRFQQAPERPGA